MHNLLLVAISFILSTVFTWLLIRFLHKLKFGQPILEDAPKTHQAKQGTPTMGGLAFVFTTLFVGLIFLGANQIHVFILLGMVLFSLIGFLDDSIKIAKKHNEELNAKQKLALQILFSLLLAYLLKDNATTIRIPFSTSLIDLGIFYYPFVVVFYLAVTNGANLTDGVDGILSSVSITILVFVILVANAINRQPILEQSLILLGALIGFLVFNRYPAKIMMGDTGSLAIGGFIATAMLLTKTPIYALFVCIIYLLESLSVIIQVSVFKRTGKRFFKKAPLHHHFEELGYSENMVVGLFSGISILGVILSLLIFNL